MKQVNTVEHRHQLKSLVEKHQCMQCKHSEA